MKIYQNLTNILSISLVFTSAFLIWKSISYICNTHAPVVVVLTGSMEPAFYRGDILFLWNRNKKIKIGDVVVYQIKDREIPIVHRSVRIHNLKNKTLLLTKGDNNYSDDISLYSRDQFYLEQSKDLIGIIKGYFPKVGYLTIFFSENNYVKILLFSFLIIYNYFFPNVELE